MSKERTTKKVKKSPKTKSKPKPKATAAKVEIKTGDFIFADFVGYTHEDHRLFDTTKEDVAKAEGVYSEEDVYGPRLVIVGQEWVVPGLEDALIGMKVGQTKKLTLEPEKAFGIRDPNQVRIIPRARIKSDQKLGRGMRIRVGNQTGTVRHVGGGRVTVDFNPPLAGHTVDYEISITRKVTKAKEKLEAFVYRRFQGVEPDALTVSAKGKTVTISLSADPRILLNQSLQLMKLGVTHDIETYMKDKYKKVLFVEEWAVGAAKTPTT